MDSAAASDRPLLEGLRMIAAPDSLVVMFSDHSGRRIGVRVESGTRCALADRPVGAMDRDDLATAASMILHTMILEPAHDWEFNAPDADGVQWRLWDPVAPKRRVWHWFPGRP